MFLDRGNRCFRRTACRMFAERQKKCDRKRLLLLWIFLSGSSEGSDYLQSVYKDDVEQKREEIFRRMDNLQGKIEACKCILDKRTESRLASILFRLKASGNLWHAEKEIRQILYLLSYDTDVLTNALMLVSV